MAAAPQKMALRLSLNMESDRETHVRQNTSGSPEDSPRGSTQDPVVIYVSPMDVGIGKRLAKLGLVDVQSQENDINATEQFDKNEAGLSGHFSVQM